MHDPILITGAARSGTSLVAGIINICGAWGGKLTGPTPNNRKGQFENNQVREEVVKQYLKRIGADPMCQDPLPDINNLAPYPELRRDVMGILSRQGYRNGPWFYKGAKMCLLWPLWDEAFLNAHWIIVRRNYDDIIDSCLRTPFMRKRATREAWDEWVQIHEERFEEMKDAGLRYVEIWSQTIINGNFRIIREFIDKAEGLEWDQERVDEFVTPELWKGGN